MATYGASVYDKAVAVLESVDTLPQLVVFDLDHTIWPYYIECMRPDTQAKVFPHVPDVLRALKAKGVRMAVASRSPAKTIAHAHLEQLGFHHYFEVQEVYHSREGKDEHFGNLKAKTGVAFADMLFFDDEQPNITHSDKRGNCSVLVDDGVTVEALHAGLEMYMGTLQRS